LPVFTSYRPMESRSSIVLSSLMSPTAATNWHQAVPCPQIVN
jgi:hypothetical protein